MNLKNFATLLGIGALLLAEPALGQGPASLPRTKVKAKVRQPPGQPAEPGPAPSEVPHGAATRVDLQAEMFLQMGRYRLAKDRLDGLAKARPGDAGVEYLLGRAEMGRRRCDLGVPLVLEHYRSDLFDEHGARALATCAARRHAYTEAVAWQEEAMSMGLVFVKDWTTLAAFQHRAGDAVGFEASLAAAAEEHADSPSILLARLTWALSSGDVDGASLLLARFDREHGRKHALRLSLEAQLELDLGNVGGARELAYESLGVNLTNVTASALLAESWRRLGKPDQALRTFQRHRSLDVERLQAARVVRARLEADLGNHAEARRLALAAVADDPWDPDALASAWYAARAAAAPDVAAWADRHAQLEANPQRTLASLVP